MVSGGGERTEGGGCLPSPICEVALPEPKRHLCSVTQQQEEEEQEVTDRMSTAWGHLAGRQSR